MEKAANQIIAEQQRTAAKLFAALQAVARDGYYLKPATIVQVNEALQTVEGK